MSWSVMTSPSMPTTSEMAVMRREAVLEAGLLDDQVEHARDLLADGAHRHSTPAMSTMVSSRDSESRGLLAWTVVIEPSWPVFMACSMSSAAPSRTSPTTMRSGLMRRAFLTRSRMAMRPSALDVGRSRLEAQHVVLVRLGSAASSMVMMRSSSGRKEEMTLSVVVFPEPYRRR